MRFPHVRFTVRGMTIAVGLMSIACLFWAAWMNRRTAYCGGRAAWHASQRSHLGKNRDHLLSVAERTGDPALASYLRYDAERHRQGAIWHELRERDFRQAMLRPWEAIPNLPPDAPWRPIPPSMYPAGADHDDFWITTDGRWGTKAQVIGQAPPSAVLPAASGSPSSPTHMSPARKR
jgi:hypothetical protein